MGGCQSNHQRTKNKKCTNQKTQKQQQDTRPSKCRSDQQAKNIAQSKDINQKQGFVSNHENSLNQGLGQLNNYLSQTMAWKISGFQSKVGKSQTREQQPNGQKTESKQQSQKEQQEKSNLLLSIFDEPIRQSSIQTKILTTSTFTKKVESVTLIQENPNDQIEFVERLGSGGFCQVYLCHQKQRKNQHQYACRVIKVNKALNVEKIKIQIAVMILCQCPQIVHYYFSYFHNKKIYMFVEYMDKGDLTAFIERYQKRIPQYVIAFILKQILSAVTRLHQINQIHRDLKSDNILLSSDGKIKIADFGYAIQLTAGKLTRKSLVGTPAWMAPEIIKREQYTQKVDIWSLGIIVIQLASGIPPHLQKSHFSAMKAIVELSAPDITGCSPLLAHFVGCCLQKDPQDRWSAKQLLEHDFLKRAPEGKIRYIQMLKYQ